MQWYRLTIKPTSAFSSPLVANTLFGQFCWAFLLREGEHALEALLQDYKTKPSIIFSDAFPSGCIPKPSLPSKFIFEQKVESQQRKILKKAEWLELSDFTKPLKEWGLLAISLEKIAVKVQQETNKLANTAQSNVTFSKEFQQSHNTISRTLGSTSTGQFAPYSDVRTWYNEDVALDIYVLLNNSNIDINQVSQCIEDIGNQGFGANASTGSGRFVLLALSEIEHLSQENSNAYLTLAACCPQGCAVDSNNSYYKPKVHFGRHGGAAVFNGSPFKAPVLLADTGSVFQTLENDRIDFLGQGVGGDSRLSKNIKASVFQGWAPVIGLNVTF